MPSPILLSFIFYSFYLFSPFLITFTNASYFSAIAFVMLVLYFVTPASIPCCPAPTRSLLSRLVGDCGRGCLSMVGGVLRGGCVLGAGHSVASHSSSMPYDAL